jgi:hypothetical protein
MFLSLLAISCGNPKSNQVAFDYEKSTTMSDTMEVTFRAFETVDIWLDDSTYRFISISVEGLPPDEPNGGSRVSEVVSVTVDSTRVFALKMVRELYLPEGSNHQLIRVRGLFLLDDFEQLKEAVSVGYTAQFGYPNLSTLMPFYVEKKMELFIEPLSNSGSVYTSDSAALRADKKWYANWLEQNPYSRDLRKKYSHN